MEPEGLAVLIAVFSLVVSSTFVALIWAAVQDGRDEATFRSRRGRHPQ
jgi:hypothetical protein